MGDAKAALESLTRYLAKELGSEGIPVHLVVADPVHSMAAKSIPGFSAFEDTWAERAPLGWDVHDSDVVASVRRSVPAISFPMTTGEIAHVDGGPTPSIEVHEESENIQSGNMRFGICPGDVGPRRYM